ncbi:MAG: hypothetical protein A3K66_03650 [Euryarchaeota archaeon RBG_16_67_27]|nr:MAG: hypothetical protein A3K66_03650 [Euryarchaeota archaeon RBG_16_67_27]
MTSPSPGVSRREFLTYAAAGGLSAAAIVGTGWALRGILSPSGTDRLGPVGGPWELAPGVVDYNRVYAHGYGPTGLGFANDIQTAPQSQRILNVAQWYDYWPGSVLRDFSTYMTQRWEVNGVQVNWTSNVYVSNEELVAFVVDPDRGIDISFPTNHFVELFEKMGLIVNLNRAWLPGYENIFGPIPDPIPPSRPDLTYHPDYPVYANGTNNHAAADFRSPAANRYAYRHMYPAPRGADKITWTEANGLLAVPYQWGTTGIGYRTDVFRKEDIEALGWEVFELSEYTNPAWENPSGGITGPRTFDLTKKKMMLDDMREVFTAALKARGWKEQVAQGVDPPTGVVHNPASPYDGEFQWSANSVDDAQLRAATDWIHSFRASLWDFNTAQQGPWLVSGEVYLDQAWSGDIMYAVRPNLVNHPPVDYFVPKQGSSRWVDAAVVHRTSTKLWLAHEFLNYLQDPLLQATISSWNLYPTPNAWTFEILHEDPSYSSSDPSVGFYWNPAEDSRIYGDLAFGYGGPPILNRCEDLRDLGPSGHSRYQRYWTDLR